ncbi:MAG: endo-1,4-beta-xylanase [Cyanobacteria bacterium P01_D01_bin.36]
MLSHAAVDLKLLQSSADYRVCVDRFQSLRCKHFHQRRVHRPDGFRLEQFKPFWEFAGNRPIHGGALIAPNAIPSWIRSLRDPEAAWAAQREWIVKAVGDHPQVTHWDVVNELWPDSVRMRRVPWAKEHHGWWIDEAFKLAREANPNATLLIKDFRPIDTGRWRVLLHYVHTALDKGIPIDGVAVQIHSVCYHNPAKAATYQYVLMRETEWIFKQVQKLGLKIVCDETIAWNLNKGGQLFEVDKFEEWQAKVYREWRQLCEAYGCEMFGVWCPTDQFFDTWHYTDRPVWIDGQAYWRMEDIEADPELLKIWKEKEYQQPRKQVCTPGLWRGDWSGRPVMDVFEKLKMQPIAI